jgi:trimeric autotransporter adhesin
MSDELRRLPPDLEALLHAERSADGPNEGARGRVRQRLEQTLGIAVGAAAVTAVGAAGTSAAAPAAGSLSTTGKLTALGGKSLVTAKLTLILFVAGGGLAAAGYFVHRAARGQQTARLQRAHREWASAAVPAASSAASSTAAASATAAASDAPAAAAVAPAAAAEIRVAVARPVTARLSKSSAALAGGSRSLPRPSAAATATATASAAHPRTLADERALLEKARTALAAGDADGALAAVSRHARLYPAGQLAEERDSLRVRAAASRGDDADVQTLGAEFTRHYPQSLFLPSVREAIAASRAQTE